MPPKTKSKPKSGPSTTEYREQLFIQALLTGAGKREAAVAAGYSERTAHEIARQLLDRPRVKARLEAYYRQEEAEVLIAREQIRQRLWSWAMSETAEAFDDTWQLKPKNELPKNLRSMMLTARTWSGPEGSGSSAKFLSPLDAANKYLKLFPAPVIQADSLEAAAQEVEAEMEALFERFETDEAEEAEDGSSA